MIHAPWVATCELAAMARDFPDIVFAVVSHSNFGFLAADPHAVQLLREAVELQHSLHNVVVAGNSQRFVSAASVIWNTNVAFLPNLYDLSEPMPPARPAWNGGALRLGLFGACRLLKNGLTGAASAASLAATLRVPTELYVSEKNQAMAELCEDTPNLKLIVTGWMPWAKFRQLVGSMHLLLQPSFTESFNVVTADGVHQGVPSVVSNAIDWAPARWQANPDDAEDLVRVAQYLLKRRRPSTMEGRRSPATWRKESRSGRASYLPRAVRRRTSHEQSLRARLPHGSRAFLRAPSRCSCCVAPQGVHERRWQGQRHGARNLARHAECSVDFDAQGRRSNMRKIALEEHFTTADLDTYQVQAASGPLHVAAGGADPFEPIRRRLSEFDDLRLGAMDRAGIDLRRALRHDAGRPSRTGRSKGGPPRATGQRLPGGGRGEAPEPLCGLRPSALAGREDRSR